MSQRFFPSNRPGYPHPVSSELESSGIRVGVRDCSVTERRRRHPPNQTSKTVDVHTKHYKQKEGRTAPGVCGNGSVPLSHSGNVFTRIHTHTSEKNFLRRQRKDFEIILFFNLSQRRFQLQMICFVKNILRFLSWRLCSQ